MAHGTGSIVGSIVERKPTMSVSHPSSTTSSKTGFPMVQHRSTSAFARNRAKTSRNKTASTASESSRFRDVPAVVSMDDRWDSAPVTEVETDENWRDRISKENEEKVACMADEEREEERRQILDRFGANIGDVLKRVRSARERQGQSGKAVEFLDLKQAPDEIPITLEERKPAERARSSPPSALVSPSSTRPSSRADRRLRFAELEPDDVHVYESAPPSPRRRVLALPPPDPKSRDTVSLGQWKGKVVPQVGNSSSPLAEQSDKSTPAAEQEPEEGSAEYIRRRYFPDAPKENPNIAWLSDSPSPPSSSSSLRFDLHGNPIDLSISQSLPTHLGLHHHAEGTHAGYTLDDIFLLSRSTVPAQRATMLGIMAQIARRLAGIQEGDDSGLDELIGKQEELRKRILAAGVGAIAEKGSIGVRAIEVVWECIVGWRFNSLDTGIELELPEESVISELPLDFLLPQIENILSQGAILPESQVHLLSILDRLSRHSNPIADKVTSTPKLLPTILHKFLLTPIPSSEPSQLPNPLALQLFVTLVSASRKNAEEVEKIADAFLRFITFSPFSSPYPLPLTINLLTWTLRVYRVLAAYGLYTHIASTAITPLSQLEQYVVSKACASIPLKVAWSNLVEAWITCAIDPHQTTPAHDIKWSQIIGWRWDSCILELQVHLGADEREWVPWAAAWKVQAAWLEGSKVNAVIGGEVERRSFIESVKPLFKGGMASQVVVAALDRIQQVFIDYPHSVDKVVHLKVLSTCTSIVSGAVRLWLACIPPYIDGPPAEPPFLLPFSRLSELAAHLVTHPLWSALDSPDASFAYFYCREISEFLGFYFRLSQRLPGVSESLLTAQACAFLLRLGPGDEESAESIIHGITALAQASGTGIQSLKEKELTKILAPFIHYIIHPVPELCIGPLTITPNSIKAATTLRLPSPVSMKQLGLPLYRDWSLSPLDHLLRSADSDVFKSLPSSWDATELEITQAALLLTKFIQRALLRHSLSALVLTRDEAVFRCMQIFMLEHGQPQNDSAEEVFRDDVAERLMEDILRVYMVDNNPLFSSTTKDGNIEEVAGRFLGSSIPFFQFYTDFVALYDAISFCHPLFSCLLLPPTTMSYPRDYRKHLWCDFGHVLRTVRTSPGKMLSANLGEYFYPVESQPQILNAFLRLLLKGNLQEFPRLVAIHHIASNLWPDLKVDGTMKSDDERASGILMAILHQGGTNVTRELVTYHQRKPRPDETVLLPPECFDGLDKEAICVRKEWIVRWGGASLLRKVEALLTA